MDKERHGLTEAFERLWSQGLVAVSTAEDEVTKAVQKIADAYGWSQEEARKHVRELTERLTQQRRDLEHSIEDAVKRTLSHIRVPRRDEIAEIQKRLDRLTERIQALEG